jgi:hypothetical protein
VRFAASYPGFAPNGGDAMAELRGHLAATGGMPDQRVWADWGTQRVLPVYQAGPFGDPRWEARSFRALNRMLRIPPDSPSDVPQPGDYVVLYSTQDRTCWHCRRAFRYVDEAFGPMPGPGWEQLFTSSTGTLSLYRLGPSVVWPVAVGDGPTGGPDEGAPADADEGDEGSGDGVQDELGL